VVSPPPSSSIIRLVPAPRAAGTTEYAMHGHAVALRHEAARVLAVLKRAVGEAGKTARQAEEGPAAPSHLPMPSCFNSGLHVRAPVRRARSRDKMVGGRFFSLVALFSNWAPTFRLRDIDHQPIFLHRNMRRLFRNTSIYNLIWKSLLWHVAGVSAAWGGDHQGKR